MKYLYESNPICKNESMVVGGNYRFSVLTQYLIRIEYSEDGISEDRSTQVVANRDFPKTKYTLEKTDDFLSIETEAFKLVYKYGQFNRDSLKVYLSKQSRHGRGGYSSSFPFRK